MSVEPVACGIFLLAAFTLAGVAQTAWFASRASHTLAFPIDGGLRLRGRRVFGPNKTIRGFVVMVPAAALAFALLGAAAPASLGIWDLRPWSFAGLGAVAGLGFMIGELPNSFVKRQLDIPAGSAARTPFAALLHFAGDRLDSGFGMLAAVSLVVPAPWQTWAVVLLVGPAIHWAFSAVMFHMGLKPRSA